MCAEKGMESGTGVLFAHRDGSVRLHKNPGSHLRFDSVKYTVPLETDILSKHEGYILSFGKYLFLNFDFSINLCLNETVLQKVLLNYQ